MFTVHEQIVAIFIYQKDGILRRLYQGAILLLTTFQGGTHALMVFDFALQFFINTF